MLSESRPEAPGEGGNTGARIIRPFLPLFFFCERVKNGHGLDLQCCNGRKRYDFSTDEGFYYLGCDSKYYNINDLSSQAFRRAYVAALFAEDEHWLNAIGKYQMLVPGSPKNSRDKAKDLACKEHLTEQVNRHLQRQEAFLRGLGRGCLLCR